MGKPGAFPETLLSHRQAQNLVMPKISDFSILEKIHAGPQVKLLDYLNKLKEEQQKEEEEEENEKEEVNPVNLSDPCRLHVSHASVPRCTLTPALPRTSYPYPCPVL